MSTMARTSLDMRGKTITTFIAYETLKQLGDLTDGESLELLADAREEIDNDIRAWCRTRGQELTAAGQTDGASSTSSPDSRCAPPASVTLRSFPTPGSEELLSPLAFALAAALEGSDVSLYFQGPVDASWPKVSPSTCTGRGRPFSRFARARLTRAGHIPAQEKLRQLQALGGRLYACAGSMQHFKVARTDLAFSDVTVAEYLTFMEIMASADINVFIQ